MYLNICAHIFCLTDFGSILYNFFEIMRKTSRKKSLRKYISANISNIVAIYFFSLLFLSNNVFALVKDFLPNLQAQILTDVLFFARHIFLLCVFPNCLIVFCYFAQTSLILHFLFCLFWLFFCFLQTKKQIIKHSKKQRFSFSIKIRFAKNIYFCSKVHFCVDKYFFFY